MLSTTSWLLIMKNLISKGLLTVAAPVLTWAIAIPVQASTALPMTIRSAEETYALTVPDTDTTRSASGGKLRVYDVHVAKMFEVTHHLCEMGRISGDTTWSYMARNGNINMGRFRISCRHASEVTAAYGLGKMEATAIFFSGAEGGESTRRSGGIPTLNITGAKIDRWMNFTRNFKPAR